MTGFFGVLLLSICTIVSAAPSYQPSSSSSSLTQIINTKVSEAFQAIEPSIEQALQVNGTVYGADLAAEFKSFKATLVTKLGASLLEATSAPSSLMSMENKMDWIESIEGTWGQIIEDETFKWYTERLPVWGNRAQKAWMGNEEPVVEKMDRLLEFVQRHSPGQGPVE